MGEISKYILTSEFICQHCGKLPPDMKRDDAGEWPTLFQYLFDRFDMLREQWGRAIPITSGYRCFIHEKEVSGEMLSPHVFGLAIDAGITAEEQSAFVKLVNDNFPELRMGLNVHPGAVHVHLDSSFLLNSRYSNALIEGMRWIE